MALGALSQAWIAAKAALPHGWTIMGLARDPDAERWVATAAGPTDTATGQGDDPSQALRQLAEALRERPGRPGPGDMAARLRGLGVMCS
jgi:hypothetical protein